MPITLKLKLDTNALIIRQLLSKTGEGALAEMKLARNTLLADSNAPDSAFKSLAQQIAARSEELDGVVATELRQLAKHGRIVTLDPVAV